MKPALLMLAVALAAPAQTAMKPVATVEPQQKTPIPR